MNWCRDCRRLRDAITLSAARALHGYAEVVDPAVPAWLQAFKDPQHAERILASGAADPQLDEAERHCVEMVCKVARENDREPRFRTLRWAEDARHTGTLFGKTPTRETKRARSGV